MANITITHPDVAKQWHPTKNGDFKKEDFTAGSGKKVWWICDKTNCSENCLHEYESIIGNRTKGVGCPYCSLSCKKICIHNSIVNTHPEIAKQFHPTKNGDLKVEQYSRKSHFKIWWLCNKTCDYGCIHEWKTTVSDRTYGCGCPHCSNKCSPCIHNSIVHTHPDVAKQWHLTKNGTLKPEQFSFGSGEKVWWICDKTCKYGCKHEWETTIASRCSGGRCCPYCSNNIICIHNSIVYTHPDIAKQWHPTKNGNLKPEQFSFASNKKFWWICDITCTYGCKHEWQSTVASRCSGSGCLYCVKQKMCEHNSILYLYPEIAKQLHPTKNGDLTANQISVSNGKNIWWLCEKTCDYGCIHEWQTTAASRTSGGGCPHCSNKCSPCIHNSIVYTHPDVAKQWHLTKNGTLKPEQFSFGSGEKVWWICENKCSEGCEHIWETTICSRTSGNGCSYCCIIKLKVCVHDSILYSHPELVKQWHHTKNGELIPENYGSGSIQRIWWICHKNKHHEWIANIRDRAQNRTGCPYCVNKTEQKLYDALTTHYPQLHTQFKVEWCKNINYLPFDFVLAEDKIIIELDGLQHFEQVSNWQSPEETHLNDVYKMKCANENGYSIIRLLQTDVFYDTYDWLKELRENIEKIKLEQQVQKMYMCKDNEYDIFA
jgi:very-short-patch-repair endonuclease